MVLKKKVNNTTVLIVIFLLLLLVLSLLLISKKENIVIRLYERTLITPKVREINHGVFPDEESRQQYFESDIN